MVEEMVGSVAGVARGVVVGVAVLGAGCERALIARVSDTSAGAYETSLAAGDDHLVVGWYDTRDGHPELYLRRLDADARPRAAAVRLTSTQGAAYEIDLRPLDDDLAVAWYEKADDGHLTPRIGVWAHDGRWRWTATPAVTGRNTLVRVVGDALFVAWLADEADDRAGVWAAWWSREGAVLTSPTRVADASRTTYNLNGVAMPAGSAVSAGRRAVVVFDAVVGTRRSELFAVDVRGTSATVARLSGDDGFASTYPDLAVAGEHVALTWFDERDGNQEVYLATGGTDAVLNPAALRTTRVTTTAGHSTGAYVAWNGRGIGLVWSDDSDGGQYDVYLQRFSAAGSATASPVRLARTDTDSLVPAIVPWREGFAVAWNEYERASGDGHGRGRSQVVLARVP